MYRIAMMVLRLFVKAPLYLFQIWWCGKSEKVSFEEAYAYVKKVTIAANKAGRVKIESSQREWVCFLSEPSGALRCFGVFGIVPGSVCICNKKRSKKCYLTKTGSGCAWLPFYRQG